MTRRETTWNVWGGLVFLASLTIALAAGWWLGHRARSTELQALRSEVQHLAAQRLASEASVKNERAENADLIRFIDEVYTLLHAEGIHIQLDLEVDAQGRYRLRADSAKVQEALKKKLQELNAK